MLLFWLMLFGFNGYFVYLNAKNKNPLVILSIMTAMLCVYEVIMILQK